MGNMTFEVTKMRYGADDKTVADDMFATIWVSGLVVHRQMVSSLTEAARVLEDWWDRMVDSE